MITIIGVIVLLASIGFIVLGIKNKKGVNKKAVIGLFVAMALMILPSIWGSIFFTAEQGVNYYVQYPTGGTATHVDNIGLTWKGFGTVTSIKDVFTVSYEKGASYQMKPIEMAFADKERATQLVSFRVKIPNNKKEFEKLIVEYRSQDNLVRSLKPKVSEIISNTAVMFTGQSYASGEIGMFTSSVRDQLTYGPYKLITLKPSSRKKGKLNTDSLKNTGGSNQVAFMTVPVVKDGEKVREVLSFLESGIRITDIALPRAKFTKAFQTRMNKQRDQSAAYQNSILERKTIVEQTKLAEAQGEKAKTIERLKQEEAAVSKITAANTKLLQDSIQLQQSKIAEARAVVEARTLRIQKDAESYAVKKMVVAGITPEKRLQMELDAEVKKAQAFSKLKLPTTYIGGGSGGKGSDPMQLLILEAIKNKK